MKTSNRLRQFATTLFESVGGLVEEVEADLIEVLLPENLEGRFGSDFLIALHPEIVGEVDGSELLTYGSPLLDDLVTFASEQGTVSRVYLSGVNLDTSNLEQNLKRGLGFEGGEMRVDGVKVRLFKYLLFRFKVRYTTDEREDEFISVGVNQYNGQIARRLMDRLKSPIRYSEENYLICPEAASISVNEAYGIAREEVERKMTAALNFRKVATEKIIEAESRRIEKFYQDNAMELLERIEKEKIRGETQTEWTAADRLKSEKRIDVLESKRQVNEIERQRRLREMSDKYTLRTSVQLINLLQIAYPKMVVTVTVVENRPKESAGEARFATTAIIWDVLTQRPEPPTCSKCGKPTTTLLLVFPPRSDAQLVCGAC